jgi:uncharacterized repeat protein (TIGR03803 family)
VLHSFGNGPADGSEPFYETLLNLNGTLYGTTSVNAANDLGGTVFSITASGKEKVLCYFGTNSCHGSEPYAGLVAVNGTLYGTTAYGGSGKGCDGLGCGTVFSITTSGTESVIHSFAGGSTDGAQPMSGLIAVNGTLYGTTFGGGAGNDGTVFSITTSGRERVLHSFGRSSDGENPGVGLTRVGSRLYGTTVNGGGDSPFGSLCSGGCRVPDYFIGARNPIVGGGTVFSITTDGREKVLHSFGARGDGEVPLAVLIYDKGKLYGTTAYGGSGSASGCYATYLSGCGTVFAITP